MRAYVRTINPHALITANNSLNSPDVLFAQRRTYGYDIQEMSRAEDFITIEDMRLDMACILLLRPGQ